MTARAKLAEIREVAEKATSGPWIAGVRSNFQVRAGLKREAFVGSAIRERDAEFVRAAREWVPMLVRVAEIGTDFIGGEQCRCDASVNFECPRCGCLHLIERVLEGGGDAR